MIKNFALLNSLYSKIKLGFQNRPQRAERQIAVPGSLVDSKYFKQCILHIGTEKTGTSAIQQFLIENRASLLKDDRILYPTLLNTDHDSQWQFVAAAHKEPWNIDVGRNFGIKSEEDQADFKYRLEQDLIKKIQKARNAETLLLSSEHFHSRLKAPPMIAALRDMLAPLANSFKIILFLRRQDRLAVSLNSTKVKSGVGLRPDLLPKASVSDLPYFDYNLIVENWAFVFGLSNICVRIYEENSPTTGNLISDFCNECEISEKKGYKTRLVNRSLNKQGFQFLQAANQQIPAFIDEKKNPERLELVHYINQLCPGKYYPVTVTQAQEFYEKFRNSNDALRAKLFPGQTDSLFDEDFSEYPEDNAVQDPDYEEAVSLAIALWRAANKK